MIYRTGQMYKRKNRIDVQEKKLVDSNNYTVPNKERTYGKFGWKKNNCTFTIIQ